MNRHRIVAICASVCLTSGVNAARVQLDAVAAFVNAEVLTVSDIIRAAPGLQQRLAASDDRDMLNAAYREALDQAIGQRLVLSAYEAQKKLKIPDAMVRQRIDGIVREMFGGDRTAMLEALADEGLSYQKWESQMREQVIVRAMRNVHVGGSIRVSPVAVRERYQALRDELVTAGSATLAMIVLPEDRDALAQDLYERLVAGEDFAALAREHSIGARADEGGARGRMDLDMLRDELADAVHAAHAGGFTPPVLAGDRIYVIKVDDYEPGGAIAFADVASRIEDSLRAEKEQQLHREWIEQLRRDAFVRVLESAPF